MLSKLKLLGVLAIGLVFISSSIAGIVGTIRINSKLNDLVDMRTEIAVEGTTAIVMDDLSRSVRGTNEQTKSSIERLDAIQATLESKPDVVTVVRTEVIKQVIEKDSSHETPQAVAPSSLDTALRAVDELWWDYCQRFPEDKSCNVRKDYRGSMQTQPTP